MTVIFTSDPAERQIADELHGLPFEEAAATIADLAYRLPKKVFRR